MRYALITLTLLCVFRVQAQELQANWKWSWPGRDTSKRWSPLSWAASCRNIYGIGKLIQGHIDLRWAPEPNWVASVNVGCLPDKWFTKWTSSASFSRMISSWMALSTSLDYEQWNFTEDVQHIRQLQLRLNGLFSAGPLQYMAGISVKPELNPSNRTGTRLSGNVAIRYRATSQFELLSRFNGPGGPEISMLDIEGLHKVHNDWAYGVAIGLPSPYFGFRLTWHVSDMWALDLRNRRHPQLGFSHECRVVYHLP